LIENSDVYFKIENCTLYNSGGIWGNAGIRFGELVSNGLVINNTIYDSNNGIFTDWLSTGLNISRNYIFNNSGAGIYLSHSFNNEISENIILTNDMGIIFNKLKSVNIKKDTNQTKEIKNIKQGYGCHIYPPIWLGIKPRLTLKDKLIGTRFQQFIVDSIYTSYKKRAIIIEKDGFIAIEEQNRKMALTLLNEIMAIAQLYGFDFHLIRDMDLGALKMDLDNHTIPSLQISGKTKRTDIYAERWKYLSEIYIWERHQISSHDFKKIIQEAEKLIKNDEISNNLNLLLGAYTHYYNNEFSMSYIMCWTLVEKKLVSSYKEVISQVIKDPTQKKRLTNKKFRIIDDKIELLRIIGAISNEEYSEYMKFKKIRNRIIHKGEGAIRKEAKELLDFSRILT